MTHVEQNLVVRRVEHVVERQRQLHNAQIGGQMAALFGHHADDLLAQLLRQRVELLNGHFLQNRRFLYLSQGCTAPCLRKSVGAADHFIDQLDKEFRVVSEFADGFDGAAV